MVWGFFFPSADLLGAPRVNTRGLRPVETKHWASSLGSKYFSFSLLGRCKSEM